MNLSYNAFILGALAATALYGCNVFHCVLCRLYNIRILEFSLFFQSGFSIHRANVGGIDFGLGWLPVGSYVKPLGMAANEEERSQIAAEDQPYAFFNKPGYLWTVFLLSSPTAIAVLFLTTYILGITTSAVPAMDALVDYMIQGVRAMFTSQVSQEAFAAQTQQILHGNSAVMIASLILLVVFFIINIGTAVSQMLSSSKGGAAGAGRIMTMVIMIALLWLVLWKIPMFIFSFFSWQQSFTYVTDFLVGLFIAGAVAYFLTIAVVRMFVRDNDKRRFYKTFN